MNKKALYFVVICVIGLILIVNFSDIPIKENSRKTMYCYYYKGDSVSTMVHTTSSKYRYKMVAFFYCKDIVKDLKFVIPKCVHFENDVVKVEVIKYNYDSLFSYVYYKDYSMLRGGMEVEIKTYVPSFCLHDTIPSGYECVNSKYMH